MDVPMWQMMVGRMKSLSLKRWPVVVAPVGYSSSRYVRACDADSKGHAGEPKRRTPEPVNGSRLARTRWANPPEGLGAC